MTAPKPHDERRHTAQAGAVRTIGASRDGRTSLPAAPRQVRRSAAAKRGASRSKPQQFRLWLPDGPFVEDNTMNNLTGWCFHDVHRVCGSTPCEVCLILGSADRHENNCTHLFLPLEV